MPATATAQQAARKRGFDISGHRSQPLTRDLVEEADLVVAMEDRHRRAVLDLAPGADVMLLDEGGVPDPIGGSLDDYLETLDLQGSNLPEVVRRIGGMLSESEQRKGKRK
jgi:protein-tyrosine phosphatase